MIPTVNDDLINDFEYEELPTRTFRLNIPSNTIIGFTDGLEAMKQAIFLILNVQRYKHIIYSWNYGIEIEDLFGQPISFVLPELKRRITEALLQDTRITGVDNFSFETTKGKVHATFTVNTIYGDVEAEKVVNV